MIYNDMFLVNYNSNDYQPVAESPCQMLASVLTVLLPLFVFFHLWKLLGELSTTITHGSTQSEVTELPKDLGNKETQLDHHRPTISLRGSEDPSCSDDKLFRVAHPILESSGVGPDIVVSTLIAAPALSGTDSPDSYLDQGHDGLCRLSLLRFVHTLMTLLPATPSNFLRRKANGNWIEAGFGTVKDGAAKTEKILPDDIWAG